MRSSISTSTPKGSNTAGQYHLIREQEQLTRRVVVTGVGLVCALGIGTEESWKNLLAGVSGVATITSFDTTGFDCRIGGEIKGFDPFQWIEKKELKKMGRFIPVALAGAAFAVRMSGWKPEQSALDEVGVYVSSGIGGGCMPVSVQPNLFEPG